MILNNGTSKSDGYTIATATDGTVTISSSTDKGLRFVDNVTVNDGASTVGAAGDGSVELMHAFCQAVITGRQPEKIVEEAYWSTLLALMGDKATREKKMLSIPGELPW